MLDFEGILEVIDRMVVADAVIVVIASFSAVVDKIVVVVVH